jgi:hypothetical protein
LTDVAPIELFFSEFYYPSLLAEVLGGSPPKASGDIKDIDRRQPLVKLKLAGGTPMNQSAISERNITVQLEVEEAAANKKYRSGSGIRDLRLFRNGSLVKAWRGDLRLSKGGKVVLETTIPIVSGEVVWG